MIATGLSWQGSPQLNWLRFDGGLRWQAADKAQILHQVHVHEVAYGYDSQLLTPDEVAVRIPGIDAAAIPAFGAIWNPGEGWVDLSSLINYLTAGLIELGGEVITDAGIAFVKASAGRVRAIATERYGDIDVDAALLATGSNVPHMVAGFGVTIPDATTTALLIKTRPDRKPAARRRECAAGVVATHPDGAFAVDADWATPRIEVRPDGTYGVPAETIEELLAEASHVLTDTPSLSVETCGIGPKPVPGDGEPVLGRLGDVGGLHCRLHPQRRHAGDDHR